MNGKEFCMAAAVCAGLGGLAGGASAQQWIQTGAPAVGWERMACSADGAKLVAVAWSDPPGPENGIYCSTNYGATWQMSIAIPDYWKAVASSADGTKLVAMATSG